MTDDLKTVRDFLRYAVTEFRKANLAFGHGASSAVDEAAFMVLEALNLPIDDVNPWLGARLTAPERKRLAELIAARVETRKPAAYLLNKAYVQGVPFYVDERVIVPRSYIGELLMGEDAFPLAVDPEDVTSVLDLCTGSGCLAILAAYVFPNAEIDGVDLSIDALEVARRNVAEHGLEERIALHHGDLFAPVKTKRYDLIITNPPYVDAEAMAGLSPEYRAEPEMALAGGDDGLDIVRRILEETPKHLTPTGGILCEIGTGLEILEADYPELDFIWPDTEESEGEVFWLTAEDFAG
ncbi:MAG: 50S ribosomal protein L3 N(5)-glutamine methyltransferase [Pseudomonadota bacterium]|nr:50S ribosomal protein L3 N(5)-glutamine methyltransferase [Pseudomonadota bacterium]